MKTLLNFLFVITLLEIFLGGGGRIFEIGDITLRILLFFINILVALLLYYQRGKIPAYVVIFSAVVTLALLFSTMVGWLNNAQFSFIFEDVKPLSYFYSIIFFSFYIDSIEKVNWIVSLIKKTSLFMALVYIFIQILFYFGKIDFLTFYDYVNNQISKSDFFFRGTRGLFFYKGFLYMIVGLIFWIHAPRTRMKNLAILILVLAMLLTGTRGFILIFAFIYALIYGIPLLMRLNIKFLIVSAIVIFGAIFMFTRIDLGDKEISDNIRITQLREVVERIDPISIFIGKGFGVGVPVRPVHMEIGYLELFHKQGLLGICLWAFFIILLYNKYVRVDGFKPIKQAFFISCLFVLMVSITNPFFNNPIGISLFVLTWISFTTMINHNRMKVMPNAGELNQK